MELHFKKWSDDELSDLKKCFYFVKSNFKGSHDKNQEKIKEMMIMLSHQRTTKAINRKLNRLGLVFFKINKPKIIQIKCSKCGKIFYANSKYYNQTTNKMDKCLDCSLEYNKGYNQRNRDKMLKYYRQWYQEFRKGGNHNEKKK